MTRTALFILGAFFAVLCSAAETDGVRAQLGAALTKAIDDAQSVETYRLTGDSKLDTDPVNWKKGPVWDAIQTKEIAQTLMSDASFLLGISKPCKPRFGVLFRLISGETKVDIRLCFECSTMALSCETLNIRKTLHFEPSRSKWAHWAKQAFPDDAVIQGLKEKDMPREEVQRIQDETLKLRRELEEQKTKENK